MAVKIDNEALKKMTELRTESSVWMGRMSSIESMMIFELLVGRSDVPDVSVTSVCITVPASVPSKQMNCLERCKNTIKRSRNFWPRVTKFDKTEKIELAAHC